ncbi:hypothetical protein H5410_002260 [Solanum commersonii]|uniref:Uncharacterized protein n=1 Tax=Solanum commersonii TaxID=4109 RepID=A0A9J6B2E4_SOLCO|nr:hypothetical protein H5410_002260 [Solanum commersonii]
MKKGVGLDEIAKYGWGQMRLGDSMSSFGFRDSGDRRNDDSGKDLARLEIEKSNSDTSRDSDKNELDKEFLVILAASCTLEYVSFTASQISLEVLKNITLSLISGSIEFHNQDITIASCSSHASNVGSSLDGPVPRRSPDETVELFSTVAETVPEAGIVAAVTFSGMVLEWFQSLGR